MTRLRISFSKIFIEVETFDTQTAKSILACLPFTSSAMTWGEEVYFSTPVETTLEPNAKSIVVPGEIAYWPAGNAIAIGFGPTPISVGNEIRLASPCNIWGKAGTEVFDLAQVKPGELVSINLPE
ncbi:MAG: cyclophilin-like fold protein [Pseudomonadota bacterium]|nr:cyclophilin-like fold protein [Pseudomonadota bacterium]